MNSKQDCKITLKDFLHEIRIVTEDKDMVDFFWAWFGEVNYNIDSGKDVNGESDEVKVSGLPSRKAYLDELIFRINMHSEESIPVSWGDIERELASFLERTK